MQDTRIIHLVGRADSAFLSVDANRIVMRRGKDMATRIPEWNEIESTLETKLLCLSHLACSLVRECQ